MITIWKVGQAFRWTAVKGLKVLFNNKSDRFTPHSLLDLQINRTQRDISAPIVTTKYIDILNNLRKVEHLNKNKTVYTQLPCWGTFTNCSILQSDLLIFEKKKAKFPSSASKQTMQLTFVFGTDSIYWIKLWVDCVCKLKLSKNDQSFYHIL